MSGLKYLLDTNILIGLMKGPGAARDLVDRNNATPETSAVSQITRMELLSFPSLTEKEELLLRDMLASITVLLFDEPIEAAAITLRRRTGLKLPDAMIGATASVHGLQLLTLDEKLAGIVGSC